MKNETGIEAKAEVDVLAVQAAQTEAEIRNAAIRQAERQAKMDAWRDPEAMQLRQAIAIKGAIESLWSLRETGQCAADANIPIPPQDELPKELRGQAPSYVRAMLRGTPAWEKKVQAHREFEEAKHGLRGEHPELYGINFAKVRKENPVELGNEHKVRTGKTLTLKEHDGSPVSPIAIGPMSEEAAKARPGLVARIFAGLRPR